MKFEKGKSGNPHGRPKKENCLTAILEELGEVKDVTFNGEKISRIQALAEKLWQRAITGDDIAAMKYIYDRIDGRPKESLEMEHSGSIEGFTIEVTRRIDLP